MRIQRPSPKEDWNVQCERSREGSNRRNKDRDAQAADEARRREIEELREKELRELKDKVFYCIFLLFFLNFFS